MGTEAPLCADTAVIAPPSGLAIVGHLQRQAYLQTIPLNASLELTLRCNLRCLHCYNFDRDTDGPACGSDGALAPELSLDEICRVLGELREAGTLFLALTGGEVLSAPHLFPVMDRARELGFAVQLLSNGTMLRPGVAARLAGYRNLTGVSISVYGATPEVHDGITQVRGSWRRTWAGADRLRAQGIAVRMKVIVMRANAHEVGAMRGMAEARGLSTAVDVNITARNDGTSGSVATRATEEQLVELYRGALADLAPKTAHVVDEASFPCNCARGNCAISSRGDVQPCISVPWVAGNIRRQPFAEIWRSSPVFQQIRGFKMADYPKCAPCPDKAFCSRDRSAAYNASGRYTGNDPFVCSVAGIARKVVEERAAAAAVSSTACPG